MKHVKKPFLIFLALFLLSTALYSCARSAPAAQEETTAQTDSEPEAQTSVVLRPQEPVEPEPEQPQSAPAPNARPEIVKLPTRLFNISAPDGSVISVEDAINESYCVPFKASEDDMRHDYAFEFRLPTITGRQTETLDRINAEISQILDRAIGEITIRDILNRVRQASAKNAVLDPKEIAHLVPGYDYECIYDPYKDGVLAIRVTEQLGFLESEYDTYCHFWYYDVASDRELDLNEYLAKNAKDLDTLTASFSASPEGKSLATNYYAPDAAIPKEDVVGVLCRSSGVSTLYCSLGLTNVFYWDYVG